MKISSVILAVVFLGLVTRMGPAGLEPFHGGLKRSLEGRCRHGGSSVRIPAMSPELRALKARQSEVGIRIHEVESALRKIQSSERTLKRRLDELQNRDRRARGLRAGEAVIAAVQASASALLDDIEALARERAAFEGFLEQLKNERASLEVKIELYRVSEERARTERFLAGGEERGPLDDLTREAGRRERTKEGYGGIVY